MFLLHNLIRIYSRISNFHETTNPMNSWVVARFVDWCYFAKQIYTDIAYYLRSNNSKTSRDILEQSRQRESISTHKQCAFGAKIFQIYVVDFPTFPVIWRSHPIPCSSSVVHVFWCGTCYIHAYVLCCVVCEWVHARFVATPTKRASDTTNSWCGICVLATEASTVRCGACLLSRLHCRCRWIPKHTHNCKHTRQTPQPPTHRISLTPQKCYAVWVRDMCHERMQIKAMICALVHQH